MAGDYLTVRELRAGRRCVLAVGGELDSASADRLPGRAAPAVTPGYTQFVLDLAGLTFTDCHGARTLAALVRTVPDECAVIVRSVHPAVRRVLDLLGVSLERMPRNKSVPAGGRTARLVRDTQIARSQAQATITEVRKAAWLVAGTRDSVAVTMAVMAQQKPWHAERLLALSQQARAQAERFRMLARHGTDHPPGPGLSRPLAPDHTRTSSRKGPG